MHQLRREPGRGPERAELAPRAGPEAGLLLELAPRGDVGILGRRRRGRRASRPGSRAAPARPATRHWRTSSRRSSSSSARSRRRPGGRRRRACRASRRRARWCRPGTSGSARGGRRRESTTLLDEVGRRRDPSGAVRCDGRPSGEPTVACAIRRRRPPRRPGASGQAGLGVEQVELVERQVELTTSPGSDPVRRVRRSRRCPGRRR